MSSTWTEAPGPIRPGFLALAAVVLMVLAVPSPLGYLFGGPGHPGEVPSAWNLVLAGALPAWELARRLAEGGSRRWPSIFTSIGAGMTCVCATLLVGTVLESAVMLLSRGQLGVRFPYTAPLPFFFVMIVVVVPVGALVGASGWLLARALAYRRHG